MKKTPNKKERQNRLALLASIILIFSIFGAIVFSVSRKISREMSEAARRSSSS